MKNLKQGNVQAGPSVLLALTAILTPVLMGDLRSVLAVEPVEVAASTFTEPKPLQNHLFDASEFRLLKRKARSEKFIQDKRGSSSSSSTSSMDPCDATQSANTEGMLQLEDLSTSQRETMRRQLRSGACPQEAMYEYRMLCERLLKEQKHRAPMRGPKNPDEK